MINELLATDRRSWYQPAAKNSCSEAISTVVKEP